MASEDPLLVQVREGSLSFDVYAKHTQSKWRSVARHLSKRWRIPSWVDADDVYQELLFAAWVMIGRYDPNRGITLRNFVEWNAYDKAKKSVHKSRGALLSGNADANQSRYESPAGLNVFTSGEPSTNETPEGHVQHRQDVYSVCSSERERLSVLAVFATGDAAYNDAGLWLYARPGFRLSCRLNSEDHARRVVRKSIDKVIERIALVA